MNCVSFLVSCCDVLGVIFSLFSDLGLASVVKGGPGLTKMQKEIEKHSKKGSQKGVTFHKKSVFFTIAFLLIFGTVLGSVF
jgi:hypothetical protein